MLPEKITSHPKMYVQVFAVFSSRAMCTIYSYSSRLYQWYRGSCMQYRHMNTSPGPRKNVEYIMYHVRVKTNLGGGNWSNLLHSLIFPICSTAEILFTNWISRSNLTGPQLSCHNACQIWMRLNEFNRYIYFHKVENFPNKYSSIPYIPFGAKLLRREIILQLNFICPHNEENKKQQINVC